MQQPDKVKDAIAGKKKELNWLDYKLIHVFNSYYIEPTC